MQVCNQSEMMLRYMKISWPVLLQLWFPETPRRMPLKHNTQLSSCVLSAVNEEKTVDWNKAYFDAVMVDKNE